MLRKIAAFEMRYHLRSPLFLIGFALLFLLSFGSTASDFIRIGSGGNVHVNSPASILETTGVMNLFGLFVFIAFVANVVIRDDETGFAGIVRATRMTKFDYLVGRFLGAFVVAVVVMSSVQLGKLIGSSMPWVDVEDLGPTKLNHYFYALLVYSVPTVLLLSAAFFALATATRSMMWTYLGAVGFLVLYVVSQLLLGDPEYKTLAALCDPFGLVPFYEATRYWTATQRNADLLPITGSLLYNRLIWVSIAVSLFAFTYWRFSFSAKGNKESPASQELESEESTAPSLAGVTRVAPINPSVWVMFSTLTRFDMRFVFKSPAFFVLLALGVFNSFGGFVNVVDARGTDYFPVTREMIEALVGTFSIFPLIIAVYYAGELVWRDHDRRIHDIVDATAAPNWSFMVPKVMAVSLVLTICYFVAVLAAIAYQLYHGYTAVELRSYFWWFVVPGVIESIQLAVLSVFVQALVPHKFIGWASDARLHRCNDDVVNARI